MTCVNPTPRTPDPRARQRRSEAGAGRHTCAVVVGVGELADEAVVELGPVADLARTCPDLEALSAWEPPEGAWVPLVVLLDGEDSVPVDDAVAQLQAVPAVADARLLVVTTRRSLSDMSSSVDAGHIDGVVAAPWTPGNLTRYAEAQISRAALLAGRSAKWRDSDSELLRHLAMGADAAATELLEAIEGVLGPRPRVHLRKGVRITVPQERLNQVFLVVRGRVALTVTSPAGDLILHHASTGPLVGLLALAEMQDSAVTARTTTECEMVSLTLEQLDYALSRDPRVGTNLMALSMRALSTRLRRSEELHIKNATLSAELREALEELRAARAELVEQARMATLGELTAGIAHELNNPAATVARGIDHLCSDLRTLLEEEPPVLHALVNAQERDHLPAREERALRRALGSVADPAMVRRLVAAGVHDPEEARELLAGDPREVARVESAAGIGAALRSVEVAGDHIATLVAALRAHARPAGPEEALVSPTDVAATVQDALRLLEHRLRGVNVEVEVGAEVPAVLSGPGLLAQVWTNLVSNAADALEREPRAEGSGHITVRVGSASGVVRVEVEDDGPGVPAELQEQVFSSGFTTRRGVVRYGLGLGLGIARGIVGRHGGRIDLESRPGRTVFTVELPAMGAAAGPPAAAGAESPEVTTAAGAATRPATARHTEDAAAAEEAPGPGVLESGLIRRPGLFRRRRPKEER